MDEKYSKICEWLADVFPNDVPEFEICERTIDTLYALMKKNEQCDVKCIEVIENLKTYSKEYVAESQRIDTILNDLFMSTTTLPQEIREPLTELAKTAQVLGIQDTSSSSMYVEMCNLFRKDNQMKELIKKLEDGITAAEKERSTLTTEVKHLKEALRLTCDDVKKQSQVLDMEGNHNLFVQAKANEYKQAIELYEVELSKLGFSPSLTYEELLKQSNVLKNLQTELEELKCKLELYHNLPPDPEIVADKIIEAKTELANLEKLARI